MTYEIIKTEDLTVLYITEINNSILINNDWYEKLKTNNYLSEESLLDIVNDLHPEDILKFKRILNSFHEVTKASLNTNSIDVVKLLKQKSNFTLCIHPTRACNLNCRYCFGKESYLPQKDISIETAIKAIDYFILEYGKDGQMYTIDLAGSGEPLLRFDFIKAIDEHCQILKNKLGKKIIITFPTNGTLLNKTHLDYFDKHDILYGFSLDGDFNANSNRIYKNGKAAFDDTLRGIELITNPYCGIAVTISHSNENVDEIYDFIYSLGKCDSISMHFVRDFGNTETSFYNIDIANLLDHYQKLIDNMLSNIEHNNFDYIVPLLNGDDIFGSYISSAFFRGQIEKYRCDAGLNRVAVDENGNFFCCSVMNGNNDFYIGNIETGIDNNRQELFTKSCVDTSVKCNACWCKTICRWECLAISYLSNDKKLYEPNEYFCKIKKELIRKAIYFVEYIKEYMPQNYTKLSEYFMSKQDYKRTNPAVWSLFNYLKEYGFETSYSNTVQLLEEKQFLRKGNFINIFDVSSAINSLQSGACCVEIGKVDDIPKECKTMICYAQHENVRYYLLLQRLKDNRIIIHSQEGYLSGMYYTDELIKKGFNILIGPFKSYLNI